MSTIKIKTAHDVFWLARYAHNTLDPLIEEAQRYEPSIKYAINMRFRDVQRWQPDGNALTVEAHWDRRVPIMFLHELHLLTKEQVDAVAAKVRKFIETEEGTVVAA